MRDFFIVSTVFDIIVNVLYGNERSAVFFIHPITGEISNVWHSASKWLRHRNTGRTFHHRQDDTYSTDVDDSGTNTILDAAIVGSIFSRDGGDGHGYEASPEPSVFQGAGGGGFGGGGSSASIPEASSAVVDEQEVHDAPADDTTGDNITPDSSDSGDSGDTGSSND
jgi:hypothetical protein